jgi:hypothetical protein
MGDKCPHVRTATEITETDFEIITKVVCHKCGKVLKTYKAEKIRPSKPGVDE